MAEQSFTPPQRVRSVAAEGLRLRRKFGRGGTAVGVARARDLSSGRAVSLTTIGRMVSFFARHGAQRPSNPGTKADPSPWLIAWMLWGGEPGRVWAESKWRRHGPDAATDAAALSFRRTPVAYGALAVPAEPRPYREPMFAVPEGLTVGRPLRVFGCGTVRDSNSGEPIGPEWTEAHLMELARVVVERYREDPVVIDWNHGTVFRPFDPDGSSTLGRVVGALVEDDGDGNGPGLVVIPAYNARGLEVIEANAGSLWTSPTIQHGPVYDRAGAEPRVIADCMLVSLALTPTPAQLNSTIDLVSLSLPGGRPDPQAGVSPGGAPMDPEKEGAAPAPAPEDMAKLLEAATAKIAELEAKLAEYESEMEGETDAEASVEMVADAMAAPASEPVAMASLRRDLVTLSDRLAKAEARADAAEDAAVAEKWVAEGRIAPADRKTFLSALAEKRAGRPGWFQAQFGAAKPGSVIPLSVAGHGERVEAKSDDGKAERDRIRAYAAEHKIDFVTAYNQLHDAKN